MSNFSVRATLVAVLLSTALGGLVESAYAQSAKPNAEAKSKPQPTGQMICSSSGGCRPVKPGCHLEAVRTGNSGLTSNVEVCK